MTTGILLHMAQDVFDLSAARADEIAGENSEPWLRLSLEIGIQFYSILSHKPTAELYLVSHESRDIANLIAKLVQNRNQEMFKTYLPDLTTDDFYVISLAIKGIFHSFVQEVVHGSEGCKPSSVFRAIEMALLMLNVPAVEINKTIQTTHELIRKNAAILSSLNIPSIINL